MQPDLFGKCPSDNGVSKVIRVDIRAERRRRFHPRPVQRQKYVQGKIVQKRNRREIIDLESSRHIRHRHTSGAIDRFQQGVEAVGCD